jgi:CRP-like cAMP-binding protein
VLKCKAGDHIVRHGDVGNEMFLILSGAAEVRREIEDRDYTIATLGEGEIFGEMAFLSSRPRTADIVAITSLDVLVLSQHFLKKLMKHMPETMIQVLFNLSLVLCDRLNLCTEQLLARIAADQHHA